MPAKGWRKAVEWTDEQERLFLEAYRAKRDVRAASKAAGLSHRTGAMVLDKHGLGRRPSFENVTDEQKLRVIEAYQTGLNTKSLYREAGVSYRAAKAILREAGHRLERKNRYTLDEHWFDGIDAEPKAYYLGVFDSDGHADPATNSVVLSQKLGQDEMVERFKELIQFTGKTYQPQSKPGFKNSKPQVRLNFSSEPMARALVARGIVPGKAESKTSLSPEVTADLFRHWLRGYVDGDGGPTWSLHSTKSYGRRYRYWQMALQMIGNRSILEEIEARLKQDLGVTATYKPSKTTGMQYLRVCGHAQLRKLYHYLYDDASVLLKVKHEKWLPLFVQNLS